MVAVCIVWVAVAFGATATLAEELNWGSWADAARKQHQLAGSVYDTRFGITLRTDGRGPGFDFTFVLLGEIHDNPAHHRARAWIVENMAASRRDWPPAVVFEQIRADQQAALGRFRHLKGSDGGPAGSDDLFRLLEWEASGWPAAQIYKPLFDAVLARRLPFYAGSPPRERVHAVTRDGWTVLSKEERTRLRLNEPMPRLLLEALQADLKDSHCGLLPESVLAGMSDAQRYRDAYLADALLAAAQEHGSAILIAGNGHVRSDRGVPWHLRLRAPRTRVASLLLVEVEDGKTDPATYVPLDPDGERAADYLIFTPRAERSDPCAQLRHRTP